MLWYVAKVVSATQSIVPFRDPLAEGEHMIYTEAGTSFVGAALSWLPGFDPILYHAATLPTFAAASLCVGIALFAAGRPAQPALVGITAALLAVAIVPYPSWLTETPPAAFALPLVFSLWRIWRDELDTRWLVVLSAVVALDYFQTKVIAIMALGLLLLAGLVERHRHRPDFRRVAAIAAASLALGAAVVIGLLFTFASWYTGLAKPKALPLDAVRGLTDGDPDIRSLGLVCLVAGELLLLAALARARIWALCAALVVTVLPSWFLSGYGFDIALVSEIFLAALLLLAGIRLDLRLTLAAGALLVFAAVAREPLGPQPGFVLTVALLVALGAVVVRSPAVVRVGAVAAAAAVALALAVRGGLDDPAVAITTADHDIWAEVERRVPEDGLVFTTLTGLDVTPHEGWNNYPAVAERQVFIAGWYDGRLVSHERDRDRKLAENRSVLTGRTHPRELELSRAYPVVLRGRARKRASAAVVQARVRERRLRALRDPVERERLRDHSLDAELLGDASARLVGDAPCLLRMVEAPRDALGQRLRVSDRDEEACLPLDHRLADPADGRRDDRDAGRLRLDHGEAEALEVRRKGEHLERGEQVGDVAALTEKLEAVAQRSGELLELPAELAVAGDHEAHVRMALEHARRRRDQVAMALLLGESCDVADDPSVEDATAAREALELDAERDDVRAEPPIVGGAIRLRRVDHLGPRRPAEPLPGPPGGVVAARQLGSVVRDEQASSSGEPRGELRLREDVRGVDDRRAKPSQLTPKPPGQSGRVEVERSACSAELRERREGLVIGVEQRDVLPARAQTAHERGDVLLDRAPVAQAVHEDDHARAASSTASASCSAVRSQVNSAARASPRRRRSSASPASVRSRRSAAANASTSPGGQSSAASPTSSGIDVVSDATTGVPHAIASSTWKPKPS